MNNDQKKIDLENMSIDEAKSAFQKISNLLDNANIRIRDLEQGIKGYERNNNRYHNLRNKILNDDRQEISIQEAREMLNDLYY